jgi:HSP20 family protein
MGDTARKTTESNTPAVTALRRPEQGGRFLSPFAEFDRLFDDFWPTGWLRPLRGELPSLASLEAKVPRVDVVDKESEVLVRAELPGVAKDDIDITVGENTVTIRGETKHEEKEEKADYYRCEISRGSFARTVALPAAVDSDRAKAAFKDGILELNLPKVEKSKRRTIKVE